MTNADFLQAILADPDDDTPRLIYADWLEEQGDPRGEFIRVQCELAKEREHKTRSSTEYQRLYQRNELLERLHKKKWLKPIPKRNTGAQSESSVSSWGEC